MYKRMLSVIIAITLCLVLCVGRVYVIGRKDFGAMAVSQQSEVLTLTTRRGTIYDCNSVPFTNSVRENKALLLPTAKTVTAVKEYLSGEVKEACLENLKQRRAFVTPVTADFACEDSLIITSYSKSATLCPHIIGYVDMEGDGVTGIEYAYNHLLKASPITAEIKVDANGSPLKSETPILSKQTEINSSVTLTMDSALCRMIEGCLSRIERGAVVVIDSNTGKIRAMVSAPSFNSTSVSSALDNPLSPLLNRATLNYNVGSVFKIVVSASALKMGIKDYHYTCKGEVKIGENVFSCSKKHGALNMEKALSDSCNCYFINLANQVGATAIYDMCIRLGFNRSLTLADTVKAGEGILPSLSDIQNNPSALANFSFGQGEVMLSPLHIASLMATVNSGYYITPTLIEKAEREGEIIYPATPEKLKVLEQNETLKNMLSSVITEGTGKLAKPKVGTAFGKTATAESGYYENGKAVNQSWFAGCYENYSIVVLVENGVSGGKDSAPIFKEICDYLGG